MALQRPYVTPGGKEREHRACATQLGEMPYLFTQNQSIGGIQFEQPRGNAVKLGQFTFCIERNCSAFMLIEVPGKLVLVEGRINHCIQSKPGMHLTE